MLYTYFMLKKILFFLLLYTLYFILYTYSYALELQSPRFQLDVEEIGIDIKKDTSAHTIESLYDPEALKHFQNVGYFVKNYNIGESLDFSLSPSLITFSNLSSGQEQKEAITLSLPNQNLASYHLSLIQEYPLKSFSGETFALVYSLDGSNFRPLPNQNKGDPAFAVDFKDKQSPDGLLKIWFKPLPPSFPPDATFETIVDFMAIASY